MKKTISKENVELGKKVWVHMKDCLEDHINENSNFIKLSEIQISDELFNNIALNLENIDKVTEIVNLKHTPLYVIDSNYYNDLYNIMLKSIITASQDNNTDLSTPLEKPRKSVFARKVEITLEKARNMSCYSFYGKQGTKIKDILDESRELALNCAGSCIFDLTFGNVSIFFTAHVDDRTPDIKITYYYDINCLCRKDKRYDFERMEEIVTAKARPGETSDILEVDMFNVLMDECKKHKIYWNKLNDYRRIY